MTKKKKILLITAAALVAVCVLGALLLSHLNNKNQTVLGLTGAQKTEDFAYLCQVLDDAYPFWRDIWRAGIDKDAVYETYRARVAASRTDIEFMKELQRFLSEFDGMGHLSVLDGYSYKLYADTLAAGDALLTSAEAARLQPIVDALNSPASANTYALLDQSHAGFRSTKGLKAEYQAEPGSTDAGANAGGITCEVRDGGAVGYLRIPSFQLESLEADRASLAEFLAANTAMTDLIIDIRGNSGGSDLYWKQLLVAPNAKEDLATTRYFLFNRAEATEAFLRAAVPDSSVRSLAESHAKILLPYRDDFTNYTTNETKFHQAAQPFAGTLWVLVDGAVYSASENFAMFCKDSGFATLVGTRTGGDGGMMDPVLVSLPNSGLLVRFSMLYGLNTDGSGNEAAGTAPDIAIGAGEDALETCLELIGK